MEGVRSMRAFLLSASWPPRYEQSSPSHTRPQMNSLSTAAEQYGRGLNTLGYFLTAMELREHSG